MSSEAFLCQRAGGGNEKAQEIDPARGEKNYLTEVKPSSKLNFLADVKPEYTIPKAGLNEKSSLELTMTPAPQQTFPCHRTIVGILAIAISILLLLACMMLAHNDVR